MDASDRGAASLPGPDRQRRAGRALAFVLALPGGLVALLIMAQLDQIEDWLYELLVFGGAIGVLVISVLAIIAVGKRLSAGGKFGLLDTSATILLIIGAIPALILLVLAGSEAGLAIVLLIPFIAGPFFVASAVAYSLARRQRRALENDRAGSVAR